MPHSSVPLRKANGYLVLRAHPTSVVKITLDAETFKALASSTRLTVLRALDERRKTLTELARDLELNKATVHEHLQLLTAADLIRKRWQCCSTSLVDSAF